MQILHCTLAWATLSPQQNSACIHALEKTPEIQAVRDAGQAILASGVLANLPKAGQRTIKSNLAAINAEFNNLANNPRAGLSLRTIILHYVLFALSTVFALACCTVVVIEASFLGETVYLVRNLGFYLLAFIELATFVVWAHTTHRLIWRLTRERLATSAITMFMYFPPAIFSSQRYLYEETYYTWLNAGLTAIWLCSYQILPDIIRWRLPHSLKEHSGTNTAEQDAAILLVLDDFERATSGYDTFMRRFNIGGPLQMLDSMLKDQLSSVTDTLAACLSPTVRHNRVPVASPEQLSIQKVERRMKLIFFVIAISVQIASLVSLIGQWISFVQTLIYLINISMILGRLAFNDCQPAAKFLDSFCRMIMCSTFTFFQVSIPLFTDKHYFVPWRRWVTMALVVAFEYIVLSKSIAMGLMKFFKKVGWIKEPAVNDELGLAGSLIIG